MKTIVRFFMLFILINIIASCNKQEIVKPIQETFADKDYVWLTPDGHVIPYIEKNNWEQYVQERFYTKAGQKKYKASICQTDQIQCGIKCVEDSKTDDCSGPSNCAPCKNCGCTPIISPYYIHTL